MDKRVKEFTDKTLDKKFNSTWSKLSYDDVQVFSDNFARLMLEDVTDEILSMSKYYARQNNLSAEMTCLTLIDALNNAYEAELK